MSSTISTLFRPPLKTLNRLMNRRPSQTELEKFDIVKPQTNDTFTTTSFEPKSIGQHIIEPKILAESLSQSNATKPPIKPKAGLTQSPRTLRKTKSLSALSSKEALLNNAFAQQLVGKSAGIRDTFGDKNAKKILSKASKERLVKTHKIDNPVERFGMPIVH